MRNNVLNRNESGMSVATVSVIFLVMVLISIVVVTVAMMRENAEIMKAIKKLEATKQGVILFNQKYKYLPGDFPNSDGALSSISGGNGDGFISCTGLGDECWKAPQHLAAASMIPDEGFNGLDIGIPFFKNVILPEHLTHRLFQMKEGELTLRGWSNVTQAQASAIDSKIDDGIPTHGNIISTQAFPNYIGVSCVKEEHGLANADYLTYEGKGRYFSNMPNLICSITMRVN